MDMSMKVMRWCSCALVLCMVMLGSCVRDDEPKGVKEYVKVGDRLPRFSVKLLDGTEVNNATWEGKALVLVFFSTKCPDCQHELPEVERFYQQVSGRADVFTLAVSREEGYEKVRDYWQEHGLTIPCSPQEDRHIYHLFATGIVPRIYIVNPQGKVTHMYGDTDMPSAEALLQAVGQ